MLVLATATWICNAGQAHATDDPWPEQHPVEQTASQFSSRTFSLRPDGKAVALSLDGDIWLLKPDVEALGWYGRLPLGTEITRVTRGGQIVAAQPRSRWIHRLPTWLPDERFVYLRSTLYQDPDHEGPDDRELWIAERSGTRKLADLTHSLQTMAPDPSGSRLLCLIGRSSNPPKGALSIVDLKTGVAKIFETQELPAAPAEAVWSPDGRAIALAVPKGNSLELYRLDVEPGTLGRLTGFNTTTQPITPPALAWPPDGDSLLVHAWDPGAAPGTIPAHGGIWRVPIEGGDPKQLVKPQPGLSWPRWSPDGRWLAYLNQSDGYRYALHLASGRSLRLGGWSRQEPEGIIFQWENDSRHVWYPCPSGTCRTTLPAT